MLLPEVDGLLVWVNGVSHPYIHELCLAMCDSGDLSAGEAFQERLLQPYAQLTWTVNAQSVPRQVEVLFSQVCWKG